MQAGGVLPRITSPWWKVRTPCSSRSCVRTKHLHGQGQGRGLPEQVLSTTSCRLQPDSIPWAHVRRVSVAARIALVHSAWLMRMATCYLDAGQMGLRLGDGAAAFRAHAPSAASHARCQHHGSHMRACMGSDTLTQTEACTSFSGPCDLLGAEDAMSGYETTAKGRGMPPVEPELFRLLPVESQVSRFGSLDVGGKLSSFPSPPSLPSLVSDGGEWMSGSSAAVRHMSV